MYEIRPTQQAYFLMRAVQLGLAVMSGFALLGFLATLVTHDYCLNTKKLVRGALMVLSSMLAFSLAAGSCVRFPPYTAAEIGNLKAQGAGLVERIEAFRGREGRYPASLDALRLLPDASKTRFGSFAYESVPDGSSFRLSVGVYECHLFELTWESKKGAWREDG